MAIENALKYQQAESSATTDYLTGLPNARSLFLQLDRELARCKRDSSTLTVMVCDMDGFKQINDRFGHLEGNRVLRLFAQALKETCREYDYVARMGGDEFVVVAPGLPAGRCCQEMRSDSRELARLAGREVCGEDLLSLSVGQAFYPDDGHDAEELLAEADRRMYRGETAATFPQEPAPVSPHEVARHHRASAERRSAPLLGNLIDISLGGCYVETSAIVTTGTSLKLTFSIDDGRLQTEGAVVRSDPGTGIAVQFNEMNRDDREKMNRILEFVNNTTDFYNKRYLAKLQRN